MHFHLPYVFKGSVFGPLLQLRVRIHKNLIIMDAIFVFEMDKVIKINYRLLKPAFFYYSDRLYGYWLQLSNVHIG